MILIEFLSLFSAEKRYVAHSFKIVFINEAATH
jgi:hypothetical protein